MGFLSNHEMVIETVISRFLLQLKVASAEGGLFFFLFSHENIFYSSCLEQPWQDISNLDDKICCCGKLT